MENEIINETKENSEIELITQPPIIVDDSKYIKSPTEIKITSLNGDHHTENNILFDTTDDLSCSSSENDGLVIDNKDENILEEINKPNQIPLKRKCEFEENLENKSDAANYKKMLFSTYHHPQQDLDLPQNLFNDNNDILTPIPISQPNWNYINPSNFSTKDIKQLLKEQFKYNRKGFKGKFNQFDSNLTNEYAQYLGLQPAIKFKCFKCAESNFTSLLELKDHQTDCLNNKSTQSIGTPSSNINSSSGPSPGTTDKSIASTISPTKYNNNSEKYFKNKILSNTNSDPSTKFRITRKVFLCSACGTYYENWNLFLHMREVHKRHICLYCLGLFPTSERLVNHLENKHSIEEKKYDSRETLIKSYNTPCYLMCSNCEHVFNELDNFHNHLCENYLEPCSLCGMKGVHLPNCKAVLKIPTKNLKDSKKRKLCKQNQHQNPTQQKLDILQQNNLQKYQQEKLENSEQVLNGNPINKTIEDADKNKYNGVLETGNVKFKTDLGTVNGFAELLKTPSDNLSSMENITNIPPGFYSDISAQAVKDNSSLSNSLKETNISDDSSNQSSPSPTITSSSSDDDCENAETKIIKNASSNFATIISKFSDENEINTSNGTLLVPKLKIKFNPKAFNTIEAEESSSDSEDEQDSSTLKEMDVENDANKGEYKTDKFIDTAAEEYENSTTDNEDYDKVLVKNRGAKDQELKDIKKENEENDQDIFINKLNLENQIESIEPVIINMEDKIKDCKNKYINENDIKNVFQEEVSQISNHLYDGINVAGDDALTFDLILEQPLDKIPIRDFMRNCLRASFPYCLFCNHARRIAVNGKSLAVHLIAQHKYSATVDSITAEELLPNTIVIKLQTHLEELDSMFFNLDSYDSENKEITPLPEKIFECFQCRFITTIHKELYLHNRKFHLKSILLCIMCKSNFYSYSELLCHICPGIYNKILTLDLTFRCCICNLENIPSAFRLMVHLRKKHNACDVCLEECYDQSRLSNHVWKHKLHHLCYRCGIAYRNKPDITKHLFWKHGTESVFCKRCLQKKWSHVYHFCIPPAVFVCEVCNLVFNRAVSLKVHKRFHEGDLKYHCEEDDCEKKFISRKLLFKHVERHSMIIEEVSMNEDLHYRDDKMVDNEDFVQEKQEDCGVLSEAKFEDTDAPRKIKKKKIKSPLKNIDRSKNLIDIIDDLPALNLSESDSSEDDITLKSVKNKSVPACRSTEDVDVDTLSTKSPPIVDIWENFKSFQANQKHSKYLDDSDDYDKEIYGTPSILHVVQSDHDYAMMYLASTQKKDDIILDELKEQNPEPLLSELSEKEQVPKNTKISTKNSGSSSSDSSSGSDSCSCGTDCSCSSSGSSSSSSSSDEDDESSSSDTRRRNSRKNEIKLEQNLEKSESKSQSEPIDVVITESHNPAQNIDPDAIILESDLDTDESNTDEDFYDQHPQKLANQILAEKRKQLMLQSYSTTFTNTIVENSQTCTPEELPEVIVKEKRMKIKKKKKKRNPLNIVAPLKLTIPVNSCERILKSDELNNIDTNSTYKVSVKDLTPPLQIVNLQSNLNTSTPIGTPNLVSVNPRLSTGSGSETDGTLKRSKRRRIPNRFYGYSSDEESSSMMKPQPPPNLTWRKEDLPSPTPVRTPPAVFKAKIKSPNIGVGYLKTPNSSSKKRNIPSKSSSPTNIYPTIPTVIIRPPQPPRVEPLRVPSVPVHHITPVLSNQYNSNSSDSDSSHEGNLQILQTPAPTLNTKLMCNKAIPLPPIQQPVSICLPQKPVAPETLSTFVLPAQQPARIHSKSRVYPHNQNNKYPLFLPPPGSRIAKEGESVYCYCQCPYDEVSEMIACDGDNCQIEWFHFECVGIMVPPKGKWYCPDCKPKYLSGNNEYLEKDIT